MGQSNTCRSKVTPVYGTLNIDCTTHLGKWSNSLQMPKKKHPCTVTPVETDMDLRYSSWWPKFYKKNTESFETKHLPNDQKVKFSISKYHYFEYSALKKGTIKCSEYITRAELLTLSIFLAKKKR